MDGWYGADAGRQFSFVFNNTSYNPPRLITIEVIQDLSKPKYEYYKQYFPDAEDDASNYIKAIYRSRSWDNANADNAYWLAELLYSIKAQFLPNLEASDELDYIEEVTKRNIPIPTKFSELICKPSLAKKWGFGYLDLLNKINN